MNVTVTPRRVSVIATTAMKVRAHNPFRRGPICLNQIKWYFRFYYAGPSD